LLLKSGRSRVGLWDKIQNTDIYNQTPSGPGAIISILAIRGVARILWQLGQRVHGE